MANLGKYDIAIIGGGPAGNSAALTLRQRGKSVAVISADPEQSHLAKAEKINNYPGMTGMSGKEMLDIMTAQAEAAGVFFMHGRATSIMSMGITPFVIVLRGYSLRDLRGLTAYLLWQHL